ncbi:helix-turn-helix domain-containing protein [Flavobacterium sp. WC2409]|uniref:Helix-turn-helix domain-containing protein n=1 Tax=Flavobacterium sp. WC2409 TaxID=3234139 RepID=A0AB39W7A9_9FLAO
MDKLKEEQLIKFGLHIKKLRTELNLSQDNVALNSDKLIKATISDIENGKRNLSFTTLLDLAKGLGKHPRELLEYNQY